MNGLGLNVQGINLNEEAPKAPQWLEITQFLKDTTAGFADGQMIHVETFALSEAMSALELMDPKMDAGMDPPELNGDPVLLVSEYFTSERLKEDGFTTAEIIGIMDELFAGVIRWVAGDTLGQTIFTCLYLHQPGYLKDATLREYCLSILKICSLIRDVIHKGLLHEEEDFMFEPYTLPEMDVLTEDEALLTLTEISTSLTKEIEGLQGTEAAAHKEAILARVLVAKWFLTLVCQMTANVLQPVESIKKTAAAFRPQLELVKKTQSLGIQADSIGRMLGFHPFINRKLSVHSPPRPSEFLSRERTVAECFAIVDQLESIAALPSSSDLLGILTYLNYFAKRKPSPLIFTRSLLNQSFLVRDGTLFGKVPLNQVVRNSITQFSQSPYLMLKNPKIVKHITHFIQLASTVVAETVKIYCKNRARTRRRLKKLFIQWENLQAEADGVDGEIDAIIEKVDPGLKRTNFTHYLTSWTYHHKTRIMLDWIWMGLETEIFVSHEVLMALWYADCLLGAHLQNMQVVNKSISDRIQAPVDIRTTPEFSFQFSRQILARAILQMLCGCKTQGLYTLPIFEFLDPKVHFQHRFKTLHMCATPAPLPYEQFLSNTTFTSDQISELFSLAEDSFKVTKTAIERAMKSPELNGAEKCQTDFAEDTKAMARVCISNSIALKAITTYIENAAADPSHPKHTITLDFKYHPYFPVITLNPASSK